MLNKRNLPFPDINLSVMALSSPIPPRPQLNSSPLLLPLNSYLEENKGSILRKHLLFVNNVFPSYLMRSLTGIQVPFKCKLQEINQYQKLRCHIKTDNHIRTDHTRNNSSRNNQKKYQQNNGKKETSTRM